MRQRTERWRTRAGMTAVEVIVVIAVMTVLTATIAPTLLGALDRERRKAALTTLDEVIDAMTAMRKDAQVWPGRLSHLSTPITTTDLNICGTPYTLTQVGQWAGPYIDRSVPSTGLTLGVGVANNVLTRQIVAGTDALLQIVIPNVAIEDVLALNTRIDADNDGLAGTVRWSVPNAEGLTTLTYVRPIRGC